MPLPAHYATGTVTVAANSAIVTGTGTQWIAAGARPGDLFVARGLTTSILSVDGPAQITLSQPWPGVALTNAPHEIRYVADASRVLAASREVLAAIEGSDGGGTDVDFAAAYVATRDAP